MILAKEASRLLTEMSPEDRFEAIRRKVAERTQELLDQKIREVIAACETKVDLVLWAKDCRDGDEDLRSFLSACGYSDIKVTSDFPGYNESYDGTTSIKFSIPRL